MVRLYLCNIKTKMQGSMQRGSDSSKSPILDVNIFNTENLTQSYSTSTPKN